MHSVLIALAQKADKMHCWNVCCHTNTTEIREIDFVVSMPQVKFSIVLYLNELLLNTSRERSENEKKKTVMSHWGSAAGPQKCPHPLAATVFSLVGWNLVWRSSVCVKRCRYGLILIGKNGCVVCITYSNNYHQSEIAFLWSEWTDTLKCCATLSSKSWPSKGKTGTG